MSEKLGTNLAEVGTDTISRQAAIDGINKLMEIHFDRKIVLKKARDVVEQLPPAQPEPCEDAVSRKDCLKALSNMMDTDGFRNGWAVSRANVECMLKAMPSVTPKQRTGKWIDAVVPNDNGGLPVQVCDQCNTFYPLAYTGGGHRFCPNCGAKMEGDAE